MASGVNCYGCRRSFPHIKVTRGTLHADVPYDMHAPWATQVEQSIAKSLQNLRTSYIDSLVLHSPLHSFEATKEVWRAFERAVDSGAVRQIGISNLYDLSTFRSLWNVSRVKPMVLQNRFYAETGYDIGLREFCLRHGIAYQSFWTLSANQHVLVSTPLIRAAQRLDATTPQVLFSWLLQSGYQPLTGTTSSVHMREDLDATKLTLKPGEMTAIGQFFQ